MITGMSLFCKSKGQKGKMERDDIEILYSVAITKARLGDLKSR
jgi:hypothetical protein